MQQIDPVSKKQHVNDLSQGRRSSINKKNILDDWIRWWLMQIATFPLVNQQYHYDEKLIMFQRLNLFTSNEYSFKIWSEMARLWVGLLKKIIPIWEVNFCLSRRGAETNLVCNASFSRCPWDMTARGVLTVSSQDKKSFKCINLTLCWVYLWELWWVHVSFRNSF